MSSTKPIVSVTTPTGPIVDTQTGQPTFAFMKWLQGIGNTVNLAFTAQGTLSSDSIPFPTANALGGITTAGPVTHQWINAIDGTGTPQLSQPAFTDLSGTATALQVPVLSVLRGSVTPSQVPQLSQLNGSVTPGQVPVLSDLLGAVTPGQVPDLSALNGSVTASQVPALSVLSGQITEAQLPAAGETVTITTAKLTTAGTNGSMTFTNGILTGQVAAT